MNLSFSNGTAEQQALANAVIAESRYPFTALSATVRVEWTSRPDLPAIHNLFAVTEPMTDGSFLVQMRQDLGDSRYGPTLNGQPGGADRNLFYDVFHHELGHVVQGVLDHEAAIAASFGGATTQWAQPVNVWAKMIKEGDAETFKDVFSARRKWFNRSGWKLSLPQFAPWLSYHTPPGLIDLRADAWLHRDNIAFLDAFNAQVFRWTGWNAASATSYSLHFGSPGAPAVPYIGWSHGTRPPLADLGLLSVGEILTITGYVWLTATGQPWDWSTPIYDDFGHQIDPRNQAISGTIYDVNGLSDGLWGPQNFDATGKATTTVQVQAGQKWMDFPTAVTMVPAPSSSDPLAAVQEGDSVTAGQPVTLNPPWPYNYVGQTQAVAHSGGVLRHGHIVSGAGAPPAVITP